MPSISAQTHLKLNIKPNLDHRPPPPPPTLSEQVAKSSKKCQKDLEGQVLFNKKSCLFDKLNDDRPQEGCQWLAFMITCMAISLIISATYMFSQCDEMCESARIHNQWDSPVDSNFVFNDPTISD